MKNHRKQVAKIVEKSRSLNQEQKRDLAAVSDFLQKEYTKKVIYLLSTFDEHSLGREKLLREKLEQTYAKLEDELEKDGVEETKKIEVLNRARTQINNFFVKSYAAE